MKWLPYVVILVLLIAFVAFSMRNRRRQAEQDQQRTERIGAGTEVMTTSGLYGTVVAKYGDDTVLLSIAPGVEVKWAVAALRDADSLNPTYRRALDEDAAASNAAEPDEVDLRKRDEGPATA